MDVEDAVNASISCGGAPGTGKKPEDNYINDNRVLCVYLCVYNKTKLPGSSYNIRGFPDMNVSMVLHILSIAVYWGYIH